MRIKYSFIHVRNRDLIRYTKKDVLNSDLTYYYRVKLIHAVFIMKGPGGSMSQVVGLSHNSYKPNTNTAWVRARLCNSQKRCTRLAAASDKVYELLAHGRWFSPGTPASSATKTARHDRAESDAKHQRSINQSFIYYTFLSSVRVVPILCPLFILCFSGFVLSVLFVVYLYFSRTARTVPFCKGICPHRCNLVLFLHPGGGYFLGHT